jgi:hypothetical protein
MQSKNYKDFEIIPESIYQYIMTGLQKQIVRFCQTPILKEAFLEAFSSKKLIRFILDEETWKDYICYRTEVADGVLVIRSCFGQFPANADNAGNDFLKTLSGTGPVPLAMRKNIADTQSMVNSALAAMKQHSGVDWSVHIDWANFVPPYQKRNNNPNIGETVHNYVMQLSNKFQKLCSVPAQKEQFLKVVSKRVIRLILQKTDFTSGDSYVQTRVGDGELYVVVGEKNFGGNAGNTGNDLEKLLSGDGNSLDKRAQPNPDIKVAYAELTTAYAALEGLVSTLKTENADLKKEVEALRKK